MLHSIAQFQRVEYLQPVRGRGVICRLWGFFVAVFWILSLGLMTEQPAFAGSDDQSSNADQAGSLELRHPIHGGYWFQKDGRSRVRFFWRQEGLDDAEKILQVSRNCPFDAEALLLERKLTQAPEFWWTEETGLMCWQILVRPAGWSHADKSMPIPSRELLIVPEGPIVEGPKELDEGIYFAWDKSRPVNFYRFKISRSVHFREAFINEDIKENSYHLPNLAPGRYYVKVGAKYDRQTPLVYSKIIRFHLPLDEDEPEFEMQIPIRPALAELESSFGSQEAVVAQAEPGQVVFSLTESEEDALEAPRLVAPGNREALTLVDGESIELSWQGQAQAQSSEIQVASDPSFSERSSEIVFNQTYRFIPKDSSYFWRVRSFGESGSYSDWSEVWQLSIKRPNLSIGLSQPRQNEIIPRFEVRFKWEQFVNCSTYQLRVSLTDRFDFLVDERTLSASEAEIEVDDENLYYWYVACLDSDRPIRSVVQNFEVRSDD